MIGTLSANVGLNGTVTQEISITGVLNGSGHITGTLNSVGGMTATLSGAGSMSASIALPRSSMPPYTGDYEVTPRLFEDVVLQTQGKVMSRDVTVYEIPYYENPTAGTNGETIYLCTEPE